MDFCLVLEMTVFCKQKPKTNKQTNKQILKSQNKTKQN